MVDKLYAVMQGFSRGEDLGKLLLALGYDQLSMVFDFLIEHPQDYELLK